MARRGKRPASQPAPARAGPRIATFDRNFLEDLQHWVANEHRTAVRLLVIVEAVMRDPFTGIGKPGLLRDLGAGMWSRRITEEHRLVYRVTDERIDFLQGRYHYTE